MLRTHFRPCVASHRPSVPSLHVPSLSQGELLPFPRAPQRAVLAPLAPGAHRPATSCPHNLNHREALRMKGPLSWNTWTVPRLTSPVPCGGSLAGTEQKEWLA